MKILEELVKRGIYSEFVGKFGEVINGEITIHPTSIEDARSWLEDNGIDTTPESKTPFRRVISPEEFKLYHWAPVVNALLDIIEDPTVEFDKFWFTYHASVLYTIPRDRLNGFPETIARVRKFVEDRFIEPYRKVNGEIDKDALFHDQAYVTHVQIPYQGLFGNSGYYGNLKTKRECIGTP